MSMLGWVVTLAPLGFILAMNFGLQRIECGIGLGPPVCGLQCDHGRFAQQRLLGLQHGELDAGLWHHRGHFPRDVRHRLHHLDRPQPLWQHPDDGPRLGILLAMVVNWFLASSALDFGISVLGVLIFTGLIAYDTQKLKRIAAGVEYGSEHGRKLALLGATSLYLDFINLFLFLLRLLGRRD